MSGRTLVIVGGGEHARVVADAAAAAGGWTLRGYTDPSPGDGGPDGPGPGDLPYLGTDQAFATVLRDQPSPERPWLILGFGGPPHRRGSAAATFGSGARWATIVHPAAWIASRVVVGPGTVIMAGAIVNVDAVVGAHAIINTQAVVEHDVRIGDLVHIAPGAVIGGGTSVGAEVTIGLGATVRDHVTIGARSTVAMGAVVVDDVAPDSTVFGTPARTRDDVDHD